jgi:5'-3' exonuclease
MCTSPHPSGRDILPHIGGYLSDKTQIHLPRIELFLQEMARREPLYFQQRSIDEKDEGYADAGYRDHYYKVHTDADTDTEILILRYLY